MNKAKLFFASIPLIIMLVVTGCTNEAHYSGSNSSTEGNYHYDLDSGLELQIKTNEADKHLFSFEFEFNNNNAIFKDTAFADGSFNCYLKHSFTKEIINGFGDISSNVIFFDNVDDNLSEYSLHIECPIKICINKEYPFTIMLNDNNTLNNNIYLPFDNFIKINQSNIRQDFDKFDGKCVDVSFLTSTNSVDFDIRIDKSQVSTGAPIGDLKQLSKTKYIYSHPVAESENDIAVSIINISLYDIINCDIKL